MTSRPFQFRLSTLFVVTTILCLLFALAAVNLGLAFIVGSFGLSMAIILVARTFGQTPAAAGVWSIIGTPVCTGCFYLLLAAIHWPFLKDEQAAYTSLGFIVLIAAYCGLLGLVPGIVIAVGYWVLIAVRSLIFNRWDKYVVDDEAPAK